MKNAEQATDHLFTNGAGEKARRLVLELEDGRDGGGWCRGAVLDAIREAEDAALERAAQEVEGHHFCPTADEMQGICDCKERADAVRALKSTG